MPTKDFTEKWNQLNSNKKKFRGLTAVVVVIVLVLIVVSGSFYSVSEQEQAVVTAFGKAVDVNTAGVYFKIPLLQKVHKVDATTKGMQIGYNTSNNYESGYASTIEREAVMITSDFNFVDIDFYLEYRVSDPVRFLYASGDPVAILKNLTQANIRSIVSNYTVDEVITTGKSQIQAEVREKLMADLNEANIGLEVVNLSVQDAEPPTNSVMQAFKSVETAKQGADTAINNANAYMNAQLPAAEAAADKIEQEAAAAKAARIAEAEGQVARFVQIYDQYKNNPEITKKRLFYETMEEVLSGVKVVISDGTVQTVLPLDSFSQEVSGTN